MKPQGPTNKTSERTEDSSTLVNGEEFTKEELLALQELANITPSNEALRALAAKSPPPPEWFDEDDEGELPS